MVVLNTVGKPLGVAFLTDDSHQRISGRFSNRDVGVVLEKHPKFLQVKIVMRTGEVGWGQNYDFLRV